MIGSAQKYNQTFFSVLRCLVRKGQLTYFKKMYRYILLLMSWGKIKFNRRGYLLNVPCGGAILKVVKPGRIFSPGRRLLKSFSECFINSHLLSLGLYRCRRAVAVTATFGFFLSACYSGEEKYSPFIL